MCIRDRSTVLVITAALIIWLQNRVLARGRYQIIAGKSFRPAELKLRGLRIPLLCLCIAYIGFTIVLPTVTIFMVGGLNTYGPVSYTHLDVYKRQLRYWS